VPTSEQYYCRGCGSPATDLVLDLGDIPASDLFPAADEPLDEPRWSLTLYLCRDCLLVQLGPNEQPEPEAPRALESSTALAHALESSASVVALEQLGAGQSVIEIDSHHGGSWLGGFRAAGLVPREADEQADLVADVHGLAHEAAIDGPLAAHARRMLPGARLVLEFHHLLPLVEQSQIDTIRHGHWVYLSLLSLDSALRRNGLMATRAVTVPIFGGSLRVTAQLIADDPTVDPSVDDVLALERAAGLDGIDAYRRLGERGRTVATEFHRHLSELRSGGRSVAGYGAPSKAPVLIALAGVDETLLPFTVDLSPAKHDRRLPGTRIPIHSPAQLVKEQPDEVVILTWDIADEVIAQLRREAQGSGWDPKFFVPLPAAGYVT
jgi:hypothetical protein